MNRRKHAPAGFSRKMRAFAPRSLGGVLAAGLVLIVLAGSTELWAGQSEPQPAKPVGTVRYVSPAGNDANEGDRRRPWKTLKKVNKSANAGDTVVFLPGEYPGTLSPANDGKQGAPITFRSEPPLKARFVGGKSLVAIMLRARSHIVLEGLAVEPRRGRFLWAEGCRNLVIRGCRFEGSPGHWAALWLKNCTDVWLLNNTCQKNTKLDQGIAFTGHAFQAHECKRLVLEGNLIGKGAHGGAHISLADGLVVRRNIFNGGWGRALSVHRNSKRVLFEENVITGCIDSGWSAGPASAFQMVDSIFRRNLVVRNWGVPLASEIYRDARGRPFSEVRGNRFYNNTISFNLEGAWNCVLYDRENRSLYRDNIWKNNIFYNNDFTGTFATLAFYRIRPKRMFVSNAICGDVPGRKVISFHDEDTGAWNNYTLAEASKTHADVFARNFDIVPRFVNAAKNDFRLSAKSPCIDAGAPLARATSSGSGKTITVDDALWFYDGFGIAGERGDLIYVGADRQPARIVKVDRENRALLIDRDLRWQKNDPVSLPYAGKAPDLGAMEHGAEKEEWYFAPVVPEGTYWRPPADPKAPLLASDFEDDSTEQWGMLWNVDRKRNTKHARTKDTAATGKHSLRTYAVAGGATLAVDVEPPLWEIDKYPYVRFAYRIPRGVAVGIWLRSFSIKEFAGIWSTPRVCVGGSAAMTKKTAPGAGNYRLIDDDKWHTITVDARVIRKIHPGLRYLRAFDFRNSDFPRNGIGSKGDEYWLDDFVITPLQGGLSSSKAGN